MGETPANLIRLGALRAAATGAQALGTRKKGLRGGPVPSPNNPDFLLTAETGNYPAEGQSHSHCCGVIRHRPPFQPAAAACRQTIKDPADNAEGLAEGYRHEQVSEKGRPRFPLPVGDQLRWEQPPAVSCAVWVPL